MNEALFLKAKPRKKFPVALTFGFISCILLAMLANVVFNRAVDGRWLSPTSTSTNGAGALAAIVQNRGVELRHIDTQEKFSQISEIISQETLKDTDSAETRKEAVTILVINPDSLSAPEVSELLETGANIVLITKNYFWNLNDWGFSSNELLVDREAADNSPVKANCADSRAVSAKTIEPIDKLFAYNSSSISTSCFTLGNETGTDNLAVLLTSKKFPQVSALSTGTIWENKNLQKAGNAALALNFLGQSKYLFWIENYSSFGNETEPLSEFTIPWLNVLFTSSLFCVLWLLLYQARRFGKLVPEPMPVIVPAGEADLGRAQLYRASRDFPHLAKIKRANFIASYSTKYGLTYQSSSEQISGVFAQQSGNSTTLINELLFTRTIRTENDLQKLEKELQQLHQQLQKDSL